MSAAVLRHSKRRNRRVALWFVAVLAAGGAGAVLLDDLPGGRWLGLVPAAGVVLAFHRWMFVPGGTPVLNYHSVSDDPSWLPWAWGLSVTPAAFERHLRTIRRAGYTVVKLSALRDRSALPRRSVAITLDDGYLDNWVAAFPLLERHGAPATVFVSLDFIEEGEEPRPTLADGAPDGLRWDGYLNRGELRRMDASGLVAIEAHGTDHGRVPTGPRVVDRLNGKNWRKHAWVQWRATPGNKAGWYREPVVPEAEVRESGGALVAREWRPEGSESEAEYESRVLATLTRSKTELSELLGREVEVFCWPENEVHDRARELALEAGFAETTAGRGENRPEEDPRVISRVYSGDRPFGWRWAAADTLALRAKLGLFSGNYYWWLVLGPMTLVRQAVRHARKAMGCA